MQKTHHKLFVGSTASSTYCQMKMKKNINRSFFAQFPIKKPFSSIMKPFGQFNNSVRIMVLRSDIYER